MKDYVVRPGIVLAAVCGEYFLVATRAAGGKCPYIRQINVTGAYFWSLMEQGMDFEEMILTASVHYQVVPERIRSGLLQFMNKLKRSGYLLA